MPTPRKEQVSKHINGHYHCISRAVRRAFLCGVDKQSGCNYEHRRQWILDRLELLAGQFSVEVCAYAIMSNHYHLVLHVDYEHSLTWDAEEVVKRWCTLFPPQALKDKDNTETQLDDEVVSAYFARLTADEEKVSLWRERLADLSWFMRCLNEPIARQANKEDKCTGRFWEGRFKSQALLDDAALISCMAYVDLNPVRAAIAQTPEDSEFTSFAARVEAEKTIKPEPQGQWLVSFAEVKKTGKPQAAQSNHVCLPITQDEYFELVDWTGRCIRDGKRGAIPAHIYPILQRLEINQDNWVDGVQHYGSHFYKVVGIMRHLLEETERQGRKWFKGQRAARLLYQ
ncbi:transposase [Candidatus Venteria ishoeyi]|uniref:Transposase IS200-like domain-containing protein n=1 Tax=Candidatus Venteria ishoeyi TaxID=1899563 RepID=A0A1H6F944_9GAMM|nr:transposase [Candidatus Venteria ishoeyi]SEH05626.1 Uncharacterised protein [Candidatus Venteria ishoeyi]